jgi:hypothetical protein
MREAAQRIYLQAVSSEAFVHTAKPVFASCL